ncbi:fimbrillin family protein [Bacteroides fragilis]
MKNYLLFGSLALSVLGSCSNDDVVDINKGSGISFRASLDKAVASRATGTIDNVTTLQNLQAFNVTALGNGNNYFTDVPVNRVAGKVGTEAWQPSKIYYWPTYGLDFYAYAPSDITGVSISNTEKTIKNFEPTQDVANQKDLLIARNIGTKDDNDLLGVSLNFKHALSQIDVQAKCSNPNIKIEVLAVKLANMATKGDFDFPTGKTDSGSENVILPDVDLNKQWKNLSDLNDHTKSYVVKGTSPVTLNEIPKSLMFGNAKFMLIPQQLEAWNNDETKTGAYLSILCRISSLNGSTSTLLYPQPTTNDNKDGKYAFAAVAINTNWLPGKRYVYTLDFCAPNGGAGRIDPNPTDPTNTIPEVDNVPVEDGKGGDPILGKSIMYNVGVDDWTDATPAPNINM